MFAQSSGLCLSIEGGGLSNGAIAVQSACSAATSVEVVDAGDGFHYIRFPHSGKCLTVNGNAWWDGATLDQWDCLGQPNQKWSGRFAALTFELHSSQLNPGKCVTVHENAGHDGAAVNQWQCLSRENQAWHFGPDGQWRNLCHPSYRGACLDPAAPDYDCRGSGEDGPFYVGRVTVIGPDDFGLDADHDGIGCDDDGETGPGLGNPHAGDCHESYQGGIDRDRGGCIRSGLGDYDCWPGQEDGPNYVVGPVTILGADPFGLDRDGDGLACV
jgi:hypothetical protein